MPELNAGTNNSNILIIDDDKDVLEITKLMLEHGGYKVVTAQGGIRGLEIFVESEDFSLVIIDLTMPDLSGVETLTRILEMNSSQKVMIASGYDSLESAEEAMKLGASYFMEKPFDLEELLKVIKNIINGE